MALQYSTTLRTNQAAQLQATGGNSAVLKIFQQAVPANCAAADPATVLCTITLPSTFLTASNGATALAGTWSGTGAAAAGTGTTALSFRIYDGSSVCHIQGTVGATGGGADMTLNNTSIANGQAVSITGFAVTIGNA